MFTFSAELGKRGSAGAVHRLSGLSPRFPEYAAPVRRALGLPAVVCLDDLESEVLQLGEQGAEFFRVVEQGLVFGEFGRDELAGDGLAGDLAGPFGVRAVQAGRVGVAAAAGLAAGVGADGEGAGQGGAGRGGDLGGDLVKGRALGGAWFHAAHRLRSAGLASSRSIFLREGPAGEGSWGRCCTRR
jgi:hypothetical protein